MSESLHCIMTITCLLKPAIKGHNKDNEYDRIRNLTGKRKAELYVKEK